MNQDPSTAPDVDAVVKRAKPVRDRLERTIFALPGRGRVTAQNCTELAAQLRGLAKMFDRHARTRDAAPSASGADAQQQGPVWTFPGQQR